MGQGYVYQEICDIDYNGRALEMLDHLPWSKLWKLHGGGGRGANELRNQADVRILIRLAVCPPRAHRIAMLNTVTKMINYQVNCSGSYRVQCQLC